MKTHSSSLLLGAGLLTWLATPLPLPAQESPIIGSWPGYLRATPIDLMVVSNRAYVALGNAGLAIFDVTDPAQPQRLGGVALDGIAIAVHVAGDYAYVASGPQGLAVVDVRDPARPVRVGGWPTTWAVAVQVVGTKAFVADAEGGWRILDVSDPTRPAEVVQVDPVSYILALHVVGNYAYVIDLDVGLLVFDIGDPDDPVPVGIYGARELSSVHVAGDYAYVTSYSAGLRVLDVSDPTRPVAVGDYLGYGVAHDVQVVGNYAFVADQVEGLVVLDVRNPAQPARVGSHLAWGHAYAVFAERDHAYIVSLYPGIEIFDVSHPAQPAPTANIDTYAVARRLDVAGRYAYLADSPDKLEIIDVDSPTHPVRVGGFSSKWGVSDVRVAGHYAYVAAGSGGLLVLDVSDPTHPIQVGGDTDGHATLVQVAGDYLYAAFSREWRIYDLSNPAQPVRLSSFMGYWPTAIEAAGRYAYVAASDVGLEIIDFNNPTAPVRAGLLGTNGNHWYDLKVAGSLAYGAAGSGGLVVVDVSDPARPTRVGSYAPGFHVNAVHVQGHRAYMAGSGAYLVLDISDPRQPRPVGGDLLGGALWEVQVVGDLAYFAHGEIGLSIGPAMPPATPPIVMSHPSSVTVNAGDEASFKVTAFPLPDLYTYQWRFHGVEMPGATNAMLRLSNVFTNQSGNYDVVVRGALGTVTSRVASLTVQVQAPSVMISLYTGSATPWEGTDVGWCADVGGHPRPSLQWQFNGVALPGETNRCLFLAQVTIHESGVYTVSASNFLGVVTSAPRFLTVGQLAPVFTAHPQSQTAVEGATVTFAAYAGPGATVSYALLLNGTNAGLPPVHAYYDTNVSFHLPDVSLSDAGQYAIVASNALGVVTSAVATLVITPAGPLDRWTQRSPLAASELLLSVAEGGGLLVAVGLRGAVVISTNGLDWSGQRRRTVGTLRGVAWGDGRFVVVGDEGAILTSADGVNWEGTSTRNPDTLFAVGYGSGRFVVVGTTSPSLAVLLTSTDGRVWERQLIPGYLGGVAFGAGRFVAVGSSFLTSTDGRSWATQPVAGPSLTGVGFGNGRFVAVGYDGRIAVSADGLAWSYQESGTTEFLRGVTHGNGQYVAVGGRTILRSPDGETWTPTSIGGPGSVEAVTFARGQFVGVGERGLVLTSSDGVAWDAQTPRPVGSPNNLDGMAVAKGTIVAVGFGGQILTSTDGIHYSEQVSGTTNELHGVGWGHGLWVAVGEPGVILTSPDAVQWRARASGVTTSLKRALYASGQWTVVGRGGTILTSPDGATWTRQASGTTLDLNHVAYGNGIYVVAGDGPRSKNGSLFVSANGVDWTNRHLNASKNLRSVTFADGLFLVAGNDGLVLVSSNGLDWSFRNTGVFRDGDNLRGATWARGVWTVVGNGGLILTSTNTINWTRRPSRAVANLHGVEYLNGTLVTVGNEGIILQSDPFAPVFADLSLAQTVAPSPVPAGADLTCSLSVSNAGPDWALGVSVVAALPAGVAFVSASPGCTHDRGTVTCAVGDLAPHGVILLSLVLHVAQCQGTLITTAAVSSRTTDPDGANNTVALTSTIRGDAGPPQIDCPGDVMLEFTNPAGAVASFTVTASDHCSTPAVECLPPSGSLFPIGTSQVACAAVDAAGNRVQCSFRIVVLGARGAGQRILGDLQRLRQQAVRLQDHRRLDAALEHLGRALAPSLWLDETHLDPRHGGRVFHEVQEAVRKLEEMQRDRKSQVSAAPLQVLIVDLLETERLLAVVQLEVAAAAGAHARKLAQAREELALGDDAAANGRDDEAIGHYGKTWREAARWLRHLTIHTGTDRVVVECAADPGEACVLEVSSDLRTWRTLGQAKAGADGVVRFEDRALPARAARFFRVRLVP